MGPEPFEEANSFEISSSIHTLETESLREFCFTHFSFSLVMLPYAVYFIRKWISIKEPLNAGIKFFLFSFRDSLFSCYVCRFSTGPPWHHCSVATFSRIACNFSWLLTILAICLGSSFNLSDIHSVWLSPLDSWCPFQKPCFSCLRFFRLFHWFSLLFNCLQTFPVSIVGMSPESPYYWVNHPKTTIKLCSFQSIPAHPQNSLENFIFSTPTKPLHFWTFTRSFWPREVELSLPGVCVSVRWPIEGCSTGHLETKSDVRSVSPSLAGVQFLAKGCAQVTPKDSGEENSMYLT